MTEAKITSEGKLMTGGKEIQLTEEQLRLLGIELRKNPFARSPAHCDYYYINASNIVESVLETGYILDDNKYNAANYFSDEDFANQVALHQLLYRKLLKFAWDNACEDNREWNTRNNHYGISYDCDNHKFILEIASLYKSNWVYFSSKEAVDRAIEEVVKPFVKEHPEFVW